jgi:hypothetical protein
MKYIIEQCNVTLTAIINIHTNNPSGNFDVRNVESRNTFEIWKREERSQRIMCY